MRNQAPFFEYQMAVCEPKYGAFYFQVAPDCRFQLQYVTFDYVSEVINLNALGAEVSRNIFPVPLVTMESLQSAKSLQASKFPINLIDAEAGHTVYNSPSLPKDMQSLGKHKFVSKRIDFWFERRDTIKITIDAGILPAGYTKSYIHCLLEGVRHYESAGI